MLHEQFKDLIATGIFDDTPWGLELRDMAVHAILYKSPIPSTQTEEAFGGRAWLRSAIRAFRNQKPGSVLPLDEIVCVEDELSAVYLKNHVQPHTLLVADYRLVGMRTSAVMAAQLEQVAKDERRHYFHASRLFLSTITGQQCTHYDGVALLLAARDVVQAATTALEQLAYIHAQQ